jgi:hypothetical protein
MSAPPPIVIVSGCPGSGKTTLAKALALARGTKGVHLVSDVFYGFPAAPIDPTHPDSREQNTVIMRALARAARAFAEGGYHVVLDGIFGPWFLPVLQEELSGAPPVSYPCSASRSPKRCGACASARARARAPP